MLALQQYEDTCCSTCGGYLPDTTSDSAETSYSVPPPSRCHRCTAIAQRAAEHHESPHPQALLYRVERR